MLARICDACGELLAGESCVQLTKRTIKTDQDNNQITTDNTMGEYCKPCLDNGFAIKDLLDYGINRDDSKS